MRAAVLVSKRKTARTTIGRQNAIKIALRRRNSTNRREVTLSFRQNRINDCEMLTAVLVSKQKTACTTFGM